MKNNARGFVEQRLPAAPGVTLTLRKTGTRYRLVGLVAGGVFFYGEAEAGEGFPVADIANRITERHAGKTWPVDGKFLTVTGYGGTAHVEPRRGQWN